jgi:uncharacterized membrane protein YfcA
MMIAAFVAAGFVVGTLVGISGVGGGSIMTPVLILLMGVNPLAAIGTDLMYSVPTKIFGTYLHAQQETLDWRLVRKLCAGGLPGTALGIAALFILRAHADPTFVNLLLKRAVGAALVVAAAGLIGGLFVRRRDSSSTPAPDYSTALVVAAGAVTGFVVATTSIGSGAMMLPLLLVLAPRLGLRRLIGSDIAFAAILIPLAALGHTALRDVNFSIAGALLAGSLPGVFVGSKLCGRLPEGWLRAAVAAVLVVAAFRLL